MNKVTKPRLAILATHPIQYHVPLYRKLAGQHDIILKVFFASDMSIRGYDLLKEGFGVRVKWDVPLLEGYDYEFLGGSSRIESLVPFLKHDRSEVAHIFKKDTYDALLIFAGYTLMLTLRAIRVARKKGIPVLIRGDTNDGEGVKRPWLKKHARRFFLKNLYSRIEGFLAVGKYMQRHFISHGVSGKRIFMSPHCVDDIRFNADRTRLLPRRQEIRKRLGFSLDDYVFMFSGRLVKKKNTPVISEAFEKMTDVSSMGLLVVGDGECRWAMQSRTSKVLGERAVFVGFKNQSELAEYYVAADALIICSSFGETWGLVVNEAQIFGLPVIASDRVGCREDLIIPEETGLVFPSGDASALVECMRRLSSDRKLSEMMGKAAREKSRKYRSEDAVNGIVKAVDFVTRPEPFLDH